MACGLQQAGCYSDLVCAYDDVLLSKGHRGLKATQQKMISLLTRDLAGDNDRCNLPRRDDKSRLQQLSETDKLRPSAEHLH